MINQVCIRWVSTAPAFSYWCCFLVSALRLDWDQSQIVSGSIDGKVALWIVHVKRLSWTRPPLGTGPDLIFAVHEYPIVSVDVSNVLGVFVSLDQKGFLTLYSVRSKCVVRQWRIADSDAQSLVPITLSLCKAARILVSAVDENTGTSFLIMYNLNGSLLEKKALEENDSVRCITSTFTGEYIATAGDAAVVAFWSPLE